MTFTGYSKINIKEKIIEEINRLLSETSADATVRAYVNSCNPNFDKTPEVVLYLNEIESKYNLWIELPLDESFDRDHIYIFDKYFDNQMDATTAFFEKVEQVEKTFEIELEICI